MADTMQVLERRLKEPLDDSRLLAVSLPTRVSRHCGAEKSYPSALFNSRVPESGCFKELNCGAVCYAAIKTEQPKPF